MSNIKNIRHIGIVTRDLEKSLNFWTKKMNFSIYKEMIEVGEHIDSITHKKNTEVRTVKLKDKHNFVIELLDFKNNDSPLINQKPYSFGITHIAIEIVDLDKMYHELKSDGIVFNSKPNITTDGYAKMVYFEAPDGVFVELVELLK